MRQQVRALFLAVAALAALGGRPAAGSEAAGSDEAVRLFEPGVVLARFVSDRGPEVAQRLGAEVRFEEDAVGLTVLAVARGNEMRVVESLRDSGVVAFAEPNWSVRGDGVPNDPRWPQQWGVHRVRASAGWDTYPGSFSGQGAEGVRVAVLDSGVDATHPDLSDGRVVTTEGADCLSGVCLAGDTSDVLGHGTRVAGIVAAAANDGVGMAGIAYGADIVPVRVIDESNSGNVLGIHQGILWAAEHGAKVINMSLGADAPVLSLCAVISYVRDQYGIVSVATVGNNPTGAPRYPAACPGVIGVASTTQGDALADATNFGPHVFVAAPGEEVLSPVAGTGGHSRASGTSYAAPVVSGLAALLVAQSGSALTPDAVAKRIAETADKPTGYSFGPDPRMFGCDPECSWNTVIGYGRINVGRALGNTTPSFSLSHFEDPDGVAAGESVAVPVDVLRHAGHSGSVTVSATGAPPAVDVSFSTNPVTPDTDLVTVTFSAGTGVQPGEYAIGIAGADGASTTSTVVALRVREPEPVAFEMTVDPDVRVAAPGDGAGFDIWFVRTNFYDPISIAVVGLPPKIAHIVDTLEDEYAHINIDVSPDAEPGRYAFSVVATGGSLTRTASATVIVAEQRTESHPYDVEVAQCLVDAEVCVTLPGEDRRVEIELVDSSGKPVAGRASVHSIEDEQTVSICGRTEIQLSPGQFALTIELDFVNTVAGCIAQVGGSGPHGPATTGEAILRFNRTKS